MVNLWSVKNPNYNTKMSNTNRKTENRFSLNVEDYILYILNNLEPEKSDKIRLNKIAFFVEFAYIFYNEKPLSNANYAAIDNGPIIDRYTSILEKMQKKKKVKIDEYIIRPLKSPTITIPEEISLFIDSMIEKYSPLTNRELIGLSHSTDSYKITTDNGKVMGNIIDKDLALLETFFSEDEGSEIQVEEDALPVIDEKKLVRYDL